MTVLEVGARGGAISLLLLLAALFLRDARNVPAARLAATFALGVAAALVAYAPALATDRAAWLLPPRILAFGNPAVFWALSSALFDDELNVDWRHILAWLALVGLGFWAVYWPLGSRPFLPANALSLLCLLLAVLPAAGGRPGDLIEARRRLRLVFIVSVALFIAAVIVSVTLLKGGAGEPIYTAANAFGALALSLFFGWRLLSLTPGALFEPVLAAKASPATAAADLGEDPREAALLAALTQAMGADRAYRDETLSIAALAARLAVPEYRLRRLINQRLGHRNFSAFVIGYRLDEIIAWLEDPAQAETPILTLALDAGFQSVGVFNRAFKARTGVTPSDYRRRVLAALNAGA